jgi:acyl carrier protein
MTSDEIFAKLKPIIAIYLPEDVLVSAIEEKSNLTGELNINSAHLVDIVLDVEDAFDIEFANEDMEVLHTVKNAIEIIQKKIT